MRKVINIVIIILSINKLAGQEESYIPPINRTIDMFPKTPDAAALSKFTDIPPGDFTGVANFTIPLYTIDLDGISIPINLAYATTGIKVGEISSRVGLGWALNTGPSVSQQVLGNRDRTLVKPVLYDTDIPEPCPYDTWVMPYSFSSPCGIALSAIGLYPFAQAINPDLQPDIFSYSLLNENGQFILDYNGEKGIPRPFNLIKIIPKTSYGFLSGIEMTDEKGLVYKFSDAVAARQIRNRTSCNPDSEDDDIPNFKLDSIITPNNKKVYYNYTKPVSASYITSITEDKIIDKQIVGTIRPEYYPAERCVNKTLVSDFILRDITFEGGKVLFYYNNDPEGFTESIRQDLIGDVYVTRVIVKNNNNDTIKDISLIYDYFISNDSVPSLYANYLTNSPEIFRRLKLTSVKDNLSTNEYKLFYYGDEEGLSLPNRMSFSQDFWGVYNGKYNTSPIASVKTNSINNPKVKVYMGANKLPDINYGVIGNLKKIIYPTGGYTQITYEADDYYKEIYNPPLYDYKEHYSEEADLYNPVEFEILDDGLPLYNQSIILYDSSCPENSQIPVTDSSPKWELMKKNTSGIYYVVESGFVCTKTVGRNDGPGTYRLRVYERGIDGGEILPTDTRTITAQYSWINEIIVNPSSVDKIGTIRVKQIESNTLDNGKIVRKYEYKNPTTNLSSGKNQGQELLVSLSMKEIDVGPTPPARIGMSRSMKYLTRSNNPGWQLNTIRGKSVGYEYVQEIYESFLNPSENYKKQSKFNLGESNPLYQYDPLSLINITYPQKILDAGLLLEEKLYNKNGDTIRYIKNEYEYDSYFNQFASMNLLSLPYSAISTTIGRGFEIKTKRVDTDALEGKYFYFNTNYFDLTNIWIKNIKTTTTDYVNNQPKLETVQTTAYSTSNTNRHTFPTGKITTVTGSNETISQSYQYAYELNQTYLKNKNIIGIPLITEVKKNGETISKTEVVYPISEADAKSRNIDNKDIPVPFDVLSLVLGSSEMKKTIVYNKYDGSGNLVQYTMNPIANGSGTPVTIIWGYNKTQPIAKVEGATYAQVSSLATSIINASNTDANSAPGNDESALLSVLNTFRTNSSLNGYQITTYSYDPLIGVRSITPPSGITEFYHYDTAGRLKEIKDINGNVLKEFKYNYKH